MGSEILYKDFLYAVLANIGKMWYNNSVGVVGDHGER